MNARLAALFALAFFALPVHATLYKWVDKDGNVIYSQTPPPAGTEAVSIAPPPPPPAPVPTQKPLMEKKPAEKPLEKTGGGKNAPESVDAETQKALATVKKKNCEIARENLAIYSNSRRVRGPGGEVIVLDDETRAAKVKESEDAIKKYCP